ncbi:HotDog domain-containing protein [Gloeopeniophorella convolvens]|nr:HotDog domain-containing protein [Gloeopeniophorella convolvens]
MASIAGTIKGNLSPELKQKLESLMHEAMARPTEFGGNISKRVVLTEASIVPKVEEESRTEARIVCEMVVEQDMANPGGVLHGACAALLIDVCSTLVFLASSRGPGVSASMDVIYHAPAAVGSKIRIINTAMAVGGRIMSARTEIWDDTTKRLCVTGIHVKMEPSPPRSGPKM